MGDNFTNSFMWKKQLEKVSYKTQWRVIVTDRKWGKVYIMKRNTSSKSSLSNTVGAKDWT